MDSAPDFESGGCGFESRRECIFLIFWNFWKCAGLAAVTKPGSGVFANASIAQLAEHLPRKQKVTSSILVGGLMGRWSRGMILPSGGRGRGFDSRTAPFWTSRRP